MSAYKKIKCELVNKNVLLQALEGLGFSPIVNKEATKLTGYEGKQREETAEIIIPKEQLNKSFTGASNDLGFKFNENTKIYDMICSDYDVANKIPQRVKQMYAKVAIEKALESKKFNIQHVTPNASLQKRTRHKVELKATKIV
jgi:hypothetical protein